MLKSQKNNMKVAYLSGPMSVSKNPNNNKDEFNRVTELLRADGWTIFNPAEFDIGDDNLNTLSELEIWTYCMKRDLSEIIKNEIDVVILLDGWDLSKGSKMEIFVSQTLFDGSFLEFKENENSYELISIHPSFFVLTGEKENGISRIVQL